LASINLMPRLTIPLTPAEFDALQALAREERRPAQMQAAHLLAGSLKALHSPPEEPPRRKSAELGKEPSIHDYQG
jgi:hypothetical protein